MHPVLMDKNYVIYKNFDLYEDFIMLIQMIEPKDEDNCSAKEQFDSGGCCSFIK